MIQSDKTRIRDHLGEIGRGTVEEALIEMYLAGGSVRRVEDITEASEGTRVSPGTVSTLNKKNAANINDCQRPNKGDPPEVFLDGIVM